MHQRRPLVLCMLFLCLSFTAQAQYDKDVFSFRGRTALQNGRLGEAVANFNILAQLDSTDYWTFFYRGIAKYNLGDIRGARADFSTAVRLNPVFTSGYHYRAITESRSGNYDAALSDLEQAISLRPGASGLYFTRGVTYFLSRQFDRAVTDFDKYIRAEPKDPASYLNRGASYLFLGDTTKALTDYNHAIKLDRFEPEGYIRRGGLEAARKQYPQALQDFDKAVSLDSTLTLAYFQRALVQADSGNLQAAMADLNTVLKYEPGNALTLYNRALLSAQVGDYEGALSDMDRVIAINPGNVLAWFNRAGFFIEMQRWDDALADYNKAIELYPDFAKAYMNRAYVELQMGMTRASREDYRTARAKVAEYEKATAGGADFSDTTRKYSSLLALDADFARGGNFENEMLRHRDVDINLKPLFHFGIADTRDNTAYALEHRYENKLLDTFLASLAVPATVTAAASALPLTSAVLTQAVDDPFSKGLQDMGLKQYSAALRHFSDAVEKDSAEPFAAYYKAFYLMNRGALRAEMIEFIASFESNVQTLTMDDKGNTRARVREQVTREYDYSEALSDMEAAAQVLPSFPYIQFNLGNLYCLSSRFVQAIDSYDKALRLYPWLGEAYFNRGLVLIYLKDKEKGCIDLSRAGELGVDGAYGVISKYCVSEEQP
ncbi:MAG: tetratricopeptide repeat protein [Bacteroidales bacterium]|nr:tetratricopeptide repeat protein [Bacteroidales bacterium]